MASPSGEDGPVARLTRRVDGVLADLEPLREIHATVDRERDEDVLTVVVK